jgi:hypothetical protein
MPSEPPREWQDIRKVEPAGRLLFCTILFSALLFPFSPALSGTWSVPEQFSHRCGNGFAIGTDGQVLTSAQVADGCDNIQAKAGETSTGASIIARDTELALLKLDRLTPNGPSYGRRRRPQASRSSRFKSLSRGSRENQFSLQVPLKL